MSLLCEVWVSLESWQGRVTHHTNCDERAKDCGLRFGKLAVACQSIPKESATT